MDDDEARARARIAAGRTRLILDRPFIGTLTLHLEPVAADPAWCDTLGTDGTHFWFNPAFVNALGFEHLQFWLAHEALHCALGHMARRAHRLRRRWDLACDHAVNQLLHDDGLTVPPGAPIDARFRGLAAEEIYPLLPEDPDTESIDRHVFERDGAGGGLAGFLGETNLGAGDQGGVVSASTGDTGAQPDEAAEDSWDDAGYEKRRKAPAGSRDTVAVPRASPMELEQLWRSRLATAAQAARDAGRLGQSWARVLEKLIAPTLPWRSILARYVVTAAREDYTFQRPPRRDGTAILPRLARGSMRIVAVLDTSGSITANELNEFAQELDALKAQVRAELTIHACDERLAPDGPWVFDPWEPVQLPESVSGGGGTRFTPVFEWVERSAIVPDLLVYFTDAQGEFPDAEPPYPVLWLVKGRAPVPFGERVQLN